MSARRGVPAPPRAATAGPGRARAAPARGHLPPRLPCGALQHAARSAGGAGCGRGAKLQLARDAGRRASDRVGHEGERDDAHSDAAGCRQGNAAAGSLAESPGGPAAPAPRAPRDTSLHPPPSAQNDDRPADLSDAQSSTSICAEQVDTYLHCVYYIRERSRSFTFILMSNMKTSRIFETYLNNAT